MIYIYEDEICINFLPLVYLRPVFELYCGRLSLFEKIKRFYLNDDICLLVRPLLRDLTKEKYSKNKVNEINKSNNLSLFISARAILNERIEVNGKEEIFINKDNEIIGFRVKNERSIDRINRIKEKGVLSERIILKWQLPKRQVNAISVKYLWDLIKLNSQELINDFASPANIGKLSNRAIILGDTQKLYLGCDAGIEAGAVIDLRQGPVYIDDNAKILALSKIIGPAYIGKNNIVDMAKISDSTIGPNCRISGEVETSIFQGFVNKHHYGFIGHSYIGEWVNLGAGTTNSDLKNNYSTVKVRIGNKEIDSDQIKVGCFIGDHAKTAIGTMIPTGAVFGIFANILQTNFQQEIATPSSMARKDKKVMSLRGKAEAISNNIKLIPNFYWSKGKRWQLEKAITTAKIVMARRNILLNKSYEELVCKIYKNK
jgi:UDP-N-acetylglucosamine diphosphorylase/glucosamine-1-phosphate N-acetyltransferase